MLKLHLPSNLTPKLLPKRNENLGLQQNLCINVYRSFISNCQKLGTTQISLEKQILVYQYNEILLSNKKNTTINTCKTIHESQCILLSKTNHIQKASSCTIPHI